MSLLIETIDWLKRQAPDQAEFLQVATHICNSIVPIVNANADYKDNNVLQRLLLANKVHTFKVCWEDDANRCRVNMGWRVQHTNALGPYKGGIRFTPELNEATLRSLALEQSFKNALTGLPLGAAKGGANFDPKSASIAEIKRFCRAYITALAAYIGSRKDVPAGDINVGAQEIGWMYGKYLELAGCHTGILSGKPEVLSGSKVREQATGFGVIYFIQEMLKNSHLRLQDTSIAISGAGNVAIHAALKACQLGAVVKSLSNSKGVYVDKRGIAQSDIEWLMRRTDQHENVLSRLAEESSGTYRKDATPWDLNVDIAIPCATQNEIDANSASDLINAGVKCVVEGANMPCTDKAIASFAKADVTFVPGKAANAGGVVLSTFEMQQNAEFEGDSAENLSNRLQKTMQDIHARCLQEDRLSNTGIFDYASAANIAGFRRLADAIVASGY